MIKTRPFILGVLLTLAACAGPAESAEPSSPDPSAAVLRVHLADFMIDPSEIEVAGTAITIAVTNDGPTPHNFSIRDATGAVVLATEDLSPGDEQTLTGELEPGEYTIFCALAGHESLGMSGTLTVTAP